MGAKSTKSKDASSSQSPIDLKHHRSARDKKSGATNFAILVTGPSGAGKSTLCQELRKDISTYFNVDIGFVYGDAYAHLSFPWRGDDHQLGIKYKGIGTVLELVTAAYPIVLMEDTFRRQVDVDFVEQFFGAKRIPLVIIVLSAKLETLINRNKKRGWPHRVTDNKIIDLFATHNRMAWREFIKIDAEVSEVQLRKNVRAALRSSFKKIVGR